MINKKNLFITGKPACGKTTLIKELCCRNREKIGGFFTEEIIEDNERQGFLLKTFCGKEGILAKKGMKSQHKLNKYGIDVDVLENLGVLVVYEALKGGKIVIIDEIGSMETVSEKFRKVVIEALNSPAKVLATIRYRSQPFTDEINKMDNASILYLSRDNYLEIKQQVQGWLIS